jgi:hypothetical protein
LQTVWAIIWGAVLAGWIGRACCPPTDGGRCRVPEVLLSRLLSEMDYTKSTA